MANNKSEQHSVDEPSRYCKQQQIHHALAPFEDALIAQLPTPDQIIQESLILHKNKQKQGKKILSLLLLALGAGGLYWDPAYTQQMIASDIGKQKQVVLNDGSRVTLNTASQIQVSYHLRSRRIQLQHGEASFEVQHNSWHRVLPWFERRFVVEVGKIKVEDIGTVFNVRKLDQQDAQVAVNQGRVRVWSADRQQAVILSTGQSLATRDGQFTAELGLDAELLTAWRTGDYYFNNQSISQVLAELNRYGRLAVKLDPSVDNLRISGQADLADRMQLIHALPTFAPVQLLSDAHGNVLVQEKK